MPKIFYFSWDASTITITPVTTDYLRTSIPA